MSEPDQMLADAIRDADAADRKYADLLIALRGLQQQWRRSADEWSIRSRDMAEGKLKGHFEGSAAQAAYNADQLAAILRSAEGA